MACEVRLSRLGAQLWAVLAEDGRPAEVRFEPPGPAHALAGAIHFAPVLRTIPELGAAFVDLGDGVEGYLEAGDLPGAGDAAERLRRLRAGTPLLVQVRREGARGKSPRVRTGVEYAGGLLAYRPGASGCRVSRRVEGADRERLLAWGRGRAGVVVRTAARDAAADELDAEWERLRARAQRIALAAENASPPARLAAPPGVLERTLRDAAGRGLTAVVAETEADARAARAVLDERSATRAVPVRRHEGPESLFRAQRLHELLERAARARLHLPSGGSVVIEPTEALVAIDVNAAAVRGVGERAAAERRVNLEAAREIARQIRLRDLSGTILIDFIGTDRAEARADVESALREELRNDTRYHRVAGWTALGLCEIARRRVGVPWTERTGGARPTAWGVAARVLAMPREPGARYRAYVDGAAEEALRRSCAEADPPLPIEIETHERGLGVFELRRLD